jgi:iron complex outermembrane receptor protein
MASLIRRQRCLDKEQVVERRRHSRSARLWRRTLCLAAVITTGAQAANSPQLVAARATDHLKQLSLDELLDLEVTSVSKRPERLLAAASAVQVVTGEDVRRSGASNLPEALRLAPNLTVAQANASQWAISARGFNNVLANKLLVLVDGRTVYTPLYAGVFWDAQDVLLEDLDRIEVISGPGGTLWGANAVNGVINVTSRSAHDTQGLFMEGGGGNAQRVFGAVRLGGQAFGDGSYRMYAKTSERDATQLFDGSEAGDDWRSTQGGFRADWTLPAGTLTLQGDLYQSNPNPDGVSNVKSDGNNVLGRWQHQVTANSDLKVQAYLDNTERDFNNGFTEKLRTYDIDTQHRFVLGSFQEVVWGVGARWMKHEVTNLELFRFMPAEKTLRLYSAFVQDEFKFFSESLRVTLGAKYEHNEYTGSEWQPNLRAAWTPVESQTLWLAASRAVRTPVRIDRDFYLLLTPTFPFIAGGNFRSETVHAYEAGWRFQVTERLTSSLAAFYNQYDYLRTAEPGTGFLNLPVTFGNGVEGSTHGLEWSASYAVTDSWRLRGGYTWVRKNLDLKPGSNDTNGGSVESNDPKHQVLVQSVLNLPGNLELDAVGRYVDALPEPHVDAYFELDLRIAWRPNDVIELALIGQNLLDDSHVEFIPESPSAREIERSVHGKITWRL